MALGPHLNLAIRDSDQEIHAFCDCGQDLGHYKGNWKLNANIYVRDTAEKMDEVYPRLMAPDTSWQVYREYTCPNCGTMLDIEAPTPWYMCMHDVQPDLKTFFEWVGIPAPAKI
jgi:acetone carboxylase gamma subunit